MIEIVYKEKAKEAGPGRKLDLPKNVRQIGEPIKNVITPLPGQSAVFIGKKILLTIRRLRHHQYLVHASKMEFEDRATRSFRTLVQEKKDLSGQKRVMTFLYTASTFLVMVVLVIGITPHQDVIDIFNPV